MLSEISQAHKDKQALHDSCICGLQGADLIRFKDRILAPEEGEAGSRER